MKKSILIVPIICASIYSSAQSVGPSTFNTAGGKGVVSGTEFEYSIGEMAMVSTNVINTITITHGVLQPQPKATDGIVDVEFATNNLLIYPNPASTHINIGIKHENVQIQSIELLDVSGKLVLQLKSPTIQNKIIIVPVEFLAAGIYMLKINATAATKNYTNTFTISKTK